MSDYDLSNLYPTRIVEHQHADCGSPSCPCYHRGRREEIARQRARERRLLQSVCEEEQEPEVTARPTLPGLALLAIVAVGMVLSLCAVLGGR